MRVLVARLDNDGDVLLAGPAVRAVAAGAEVVLLCGPRGEQAARLLPGVVEVLTWRAPWIDPDRPVVDAADVADTVARLGALRLDAALVLVSYHQSALPTALLLRLAGVPRISAVSPDYPGSLLDDRVPYDPGLHEAQRNLAVATAAGFALPPGDDGRLRLREPLPDVSRLLPAGRLVAVHPGASVPARAYPPERAEEAVRALADAGWTVLVTGSPSERELTARVAGTHGVDLGGRTSLPELAAVLAGCDAVVVGNTGPAHLAAAVGTPVVSLFAPVVHARNWAPHGVPVVLLGRQDALCAGTRARACPVPGHPCLSGVSAEHVVGAVRSLAGVPA